jgi:hypothetical protein
MGKNKRIPWSIYVWSSITVFEGMNSLIRIKDRQDDDINTSWSEVGVWCDGAVSVAMRIARCREERSFQN